MSKISVKAPCGDNPQGVDVSSLVCEASNSLPSASCAERYEFPTPNIVTLKAILLWHGYLEPVNNQISEGYMPREFQLRMTAAWKVRDAFYRVAVTSALCFVGKVPPRLSTSQILVMIIETLEQHSPVIHELNYAANSVIWMPCACSTGTFWWPTSIPPCSMQRELLTAIRLYVLHTIWSTNPKALLAVDFSAGLANFSNEEYAHTQKLIADAIQSRPPLPESAAKSDAETSAAIGESALTAEVQLLLNVLRDGEKSRQELQELLGVGRSVLLNRFLDPARETGLVMTTEQGSSPKQKYMLASSAVAVSRKQAQSGNETGLTYPVSADLVLPQKQAIPPKNDVFSPVAVSIFAGGHAPVRLARYNRWLEAERALILFGRVERFLRSSFIIGTWKELGIVDKINEHDRFRFGNFLVDPKCWGINAGVALRMEIVDKNGKHSEVAVGESNLLCLFAQKTGFDLAGCSETGRVEMGKLAEIIPPAVLQLTNFYAQRFGISRDLDEPYHGDKKAMQQAAVDLFNLYHPGMAKIVFHGKDRAPQLQVARIDFAGRTMLLPVTFYASAQNPMLYCMMPEVPDSPVLYNADAIAANPGATVILTDELGIPLVNDSDSDYIFSSWYGGMDVIDKLDRDMLDGHPIRWLCFDNGDGPAKMYEKAVTVGMIFQKHGRKIAFQVFDGVTWTRNAFGMETGMYGSSRVLSFDELKAEASKFGVSGCDSNEVADLHIYTMDELLSLKPEEFILAPVLMPGFYCLIYGGSGVAKTWFALHLAICLSQGQAPFKHWKFCGTAPLNVLYVAGEMRPSVYGKRLGQLLAEQESNPHFGLIREEDKVFDLTTESDQESIFKAVMAQQSKVVVLDNLSTLATNGHTEGQFEKILGFIRKLQADGIIVLLVHHENREGGFKGSGKIELVADQSLHLFSSGNGKKIELLVRAEKIRMTSIAEQAAFRTEFDPEAPVEVWPMFELTGEQRRRLDIDDPLGEVERNISKKHKNNQLAWEYLDEEGRGKAIIEGMLNGCHDDVIAADLAVREIVISEFKQEHGITQDTLTRQLPEARKSPEISQEKMTPGNLAPILWKLLNDKENINK